MKGTPELGGNPLEGPVPIGAVPVEIERNSVKVCGSPPEREASELVKGTPELPVPGRVEDSVAEWLPLVLVKGLPEDGMAPDAKPEVMNAVPPEVMVDEIGEKEAPLDGITPEDGMAPDPKAELAKAVPPEVTVEDSDEKEAPLEGMTPEPKVENALPNPVPTIVDEIGTGDPEDGIRPDATVLLAPAVPPIAPEAKKPELYAVPPFVEMTVRTEVLGTGV